MKNPTKNIEVKISHLFNGVWGSYARYSDLKVRKSKREERDGMTIVTDYDYKGRVRGVETIWTE